MLRGRPYRFTGINIYMAASGGTPSSCGGELYPDVGVPLSNMPSGIVFRFWAFQNFFVSDGHFDWTNMDRVLAIAAAHGDKVIPVAGQPIRLLRRPPRISPGTKAASERGQPG